MQKIFFSLVFSFSLTLFFINCGNSDDTNSTVNLPATVTNYISINYADYSIDESEQETACDGTLVYEVEIEDANDNELELTFDLEGNFLYSEIEIGNGDLPSAVSNSITVNYADYSIDESERLDMFDNSTRYEVEIENGNSEWNILMEADGTVVCEEEEIDD